MTLAYNTLVFLAPAGLLVLERLVAGRGYRMPGPHWRADLALGLLVAPLMAAFGAAKFWLLDGVIREELPELRVGLVDAAPGWLQFAVYLVAKEFATYLSHRMCHESRFLWQFHAVHHSQERLTPYTSIRIHPVEFVPAIALNAVLVAVLGGHPPVLATFGAVYIFWGSVVHSELPFGLGPLGWVLVSPRYHHVHHSQDPAHFDTNYANRLVIFDWLFGTMYRGPACWPDTGVAGYPVRDVDFPAGVRGPVEAAIWHLASPLQACWKLYGPGSW